MSTAQKMSTTTPASVNHVMVPRRVAKVHALIALYGLLLTMSRLSTRLDSEEDNCVSSSLTAPVRLLTPARQETLAIAQTYGV